MRGTGVEFSRKALLNLRKNMKINEMNGKSENILIILVKAPKKKLTYKTLFRSDSLKKRGYRTNAEDIQVFANKHD